MYVMQKCLLMHMNLFFCDVVEWAWILNAEVLRFKSRGFLLPGAKNFPSPNFDISLAINLKAALRIQYNHEHESSVNYKVLQSIVGF